MTKKKHHDEPTPVEETDYAPSQQPSGGEIQPGCSEPNTVPPSVGGTSHDPKRKKED